MFAGDLSNPLDSSIHELRFYPETLAQEPEALKTQIASNAASHYQQLLDLIIISGGLAGRIDAAVLELDENISLRNNRTKNKL